MKNNSPGTKFLMAAICLAVLAYFGIQTYRYFVDPLTTAVVYSYQVEKGTTVSGYLVRDEKVLADDNTGGLLRISRSEGERVGNGGEIAVVYADQTSLDRQDKIDALSDQIEQLQYAEGTVPGSDASLKMDSQIVTEILALRGDLAADKLDAAESHETDLRSLVMKRDYTYSDTGSLKEKIADLQSQLKKLQAKTASSARRITAPTAGIYSAVVDGYETVLTPAFLTDLTPSALAAVKRDDGVTSQVGKLILGDDWYYAASANAADLGDIAKGKTVKLRFAKGMDRDINVSVTSVSKTENGQVAVVFTGEDYLPELTLLRRQSADVITDTVTGLRVPQKALRVKTQTITDKDGAQQETQVTGLYCVVGMTIRFKPVTVVYNGDGYALVNAASQTEKDRLRAGDQVIVSANNLYDGKVVS